MHPPRNLPLARLAGCALALSATVGICSEEGELTGQLRAHDPSSILHEGDRYYVFTTGWGLRAKASADLTHWRALPPVFGRGAMPAWASEVAPGFRGHVWAPDVVKFGDEYRLYYSVSRFGKQTSAIGLAVNKTLDPEAGGFEWVDRGVVVRSTGGEPYNAIDPSILIASDGRHWMAFGSYWKGIHLMELDPATGKRFDEQPEPIRIAWAESIEAATLIERGGRYYLFINHGQCCRGAGSTYRILVGRSDSPEGPYLDREGRPLVEGGGALVVETEGRRIGPGHVAPFTDDPTGRFAFHFYDGEDRGRSKLALASWEWSSDGWPTVVDVRLASVETEPEPHDPCRRFRRRQGVIE